MHLDNLDFPFNFLLLHNDLVDNKICITYIHNFLLCVTAEKVSISGETMVLFTLTIQNLFWGLYSPKQSNNVEMF